jgi:hypothetical protein
MNSLPTKHGAHCLLVNHAINSLPTKHGGNCLTVNHGMNNLPKKHGGNCLTVNYGMNSLPTKHGAHCLLVNHRMNSLPTKHEAHCLLVNHEFTACQQNIECTALAGKSCRELVNSSQHHEFSMCCRKSTKVIKIDKGSLGKDAVVFNEGPPYINFWVAPDP